MQDIEKLLTETENKTLLVCFPHPDDETVMTSGLIQRALKMKWRVVVVCLTKGEGGRMHIHGKGRSLAEIREREYLLALRVLGVKEYKLYDFGDGRLRHARSWKQKIAIILSQLQPGLIVTYDHAGVSGHPDHVTLSMEMLRLARKIKGVKLLWPAFTGKARELMVNPKVEAYAAEPDYVLNMTIGERYKKWRALKIHRSQALGRDASRKTKLPLLVLSLANKTEMYAEANFKKKYGYRYVGVK